MKKGKNSTISEKASIYGSDNIEIGDNVRIDDFCILSAFGGYIKIGNNVHIAAGTKIYGSGGMVIEDYANISTNCTIFSASDDFSGEALIGPMIPEKYRKVTKARVTIEKFAVIAAHCTLFPGAYVAEGVALGAHTMLTKTTFPWWVYVGVPAKKLHQRKKDLIMKAAQYEKD